MFLIGIIGIIMLIWFGLVGLWKLIPWLILAVIVTSTLGFILEHVILSAVAFFIIVGLMVLGMTEGR